MKRILLMTCLVLLACFSFSSLEARDRGDRVFDRIQEESDEDDEFNLDAVDDDYEDDSDFPDNEVPDEAEAIYEYNR